MEEEELSTDNIISENEIENLFTGDNNENLPTETEDNYEQDQEEFTETPLKENEDDDEESESVGNEEDEDNDDETDQEYTVSKKQGTPNIYSSLAKALKEDGVFSDFTEDDLNDIDSPEKFRELIDMKIDSEKSLRQQRLESAINSGVQVSDIQNYEQILEYLSSITEQSISDESAEGETLRKNIIYQDYINRGYSQEKALKEIQKSFNAGTDIEDAIDALKGNWEYYNNNYQELVSQKQQENDELREYYQNQAKDFEYSVLDADYVFDNLALDDNTRMDIYRNAIDPSIKDKRTGEMLTSIQAYERANPVDYAKNVSLFYTLTDGFTNLDKLIKSKIRKDINKGVRDLAEKLGGANNVFNGNMEYVSNGNDEDSSYTDWKLDL